MKYSSYNERNQHGCCAVTRCECKLDPQDTWINSLNGNAYCGTCKDFFYNGHDRFNTGPYARTWSKEEPPAPEPPADIMSTYVNETRE